MVQINWTLQSINDLRDISDYISKDSVQYAKRQVSKIRKSTRVLHDHIYSGRIVPEVNRKDIREIIQGNYRIIYKVNGKSRVDILTIHHSARDLHKRVL